MFKEIIQNFNFNQAQIILKVSLKNSKNRKMLKKQNQKYKQKNKNEVEKSILFLTRYYLKEH